MAALVPPAKAPRVRSVFYSKNPLSDEASASNASSMQSSKTSFGPPPPTDSDDSSSNANIPLGPITRTDRPRRSSDASSTLSSQISDAEHHEQVPLRPLRPTRPTRRLEAFGQSPQPLSLPLMGSEPLPVLSRETMALDDRAGCQGGQGGGWTKTFVDPHHSDRKLPALSGHHDIPQPNSTPHSLAEKDSDMPPLHDPHSEPPRNPLPPPVIPERDVSPKPTHRQFVVPANLSSKPPSPRRPTSPSTSPSPFGSFPPTDSRVSPSPSPSPFPSPSSSPSSLPPSHTVGHSSSSSLDDPPTFIPPRPSRGMFQTLVLFVFFVY